MEHVKDNMATAMDIDSKDKENIYTAKPGPDDSSEAAVAKGTSMAAPTLLDDTDSTAPTPAESSTMPASPAPAPKIGCRTNTIDKDGDLMVICKPERGVPTHKFLVSSACVKRVSSDWENRISQQMSSRENPNALLEISLYDTDVEILEYVLQYAHHQHKHVPSCLSFSQLVRGVRFCIERKTKDFLRPWLDESIRVWLRKAFQPGYELWVLVAYEFHFVDIFEHLVAKLVGEAHVDEDGCLVLPSGVDLDGEELPGDILDSIKARRHAILKILLEVCSECVTDLTSDEPEHYICYLEDEDETQHSVNEALGCAIRCFKQCGLWPTPPKPEDMTTSINHLKDKLLAIDFTAGSGHDLSEPDSTCSIQHYFVERVLLADQDPSVPAMTNACREYVESPDEVSGGTEPHAWKQTFLTKYGFDEGDFVTRFVPGMGDSDSSYGSEDEMTDHEMSEPEEEWLGDGQEEMFESDDEDDDEEGEQEDDDDDDNDDDDTMEE